MVNLHSREAVHFFIPDFNWKCTYRTFLVLHNVLHWKKNYKRNGKNYLQYIPQNKNDVYVHEVYNVAHFNIELTMM